MTNPERPHGISDSGCDPDTFGPGTAERERWSSEYLNDLLECANVDNWRMECEFLHSGELVIRGIGPLDGQLMLLSASLVRELIATRAELDAAQDCALKHSGCAAADWLIRDTERVQLRAELEQLHERIRVLVSKLEVQVAERVAEAHHQGLNSPTGTHFAAMAEADRDTLIDLRAVLATPMTPAPDHIWASCLDTRRVFCIRCNVIRCADGQNKPCRGAVGVSLRKDHP